MKFLKLSLAMLAFAASSAATFAAGVDNDYDSGAYESGGNLLVKIRGCGIITEGDLKSLPSAETRPTYNPNAAVNAKKALKNGYGIENANTLFFSDHFATELSVGLSAYAVPRTGLQKIYNNYATGTVGSQTTTVTTTATGAVVTGPTTIPRNNNTVPDVNPVVTADAPIADQTTTVAYVSNSLPSYSSKRHLLIGIPLNLTLQYHIAPYGAIRPYIGIGGNFTYFTSKSKEYIVRSAYGLVFQAGVDVVLTDDTLISIDAKFVKLSPKIKYKSSFLNGADGVSSKMKMDPFVISAGIGFKI